MHSKLIVAVALTVAVAGCGNQNDTAGSNADPSTTTSTSPENAAVELVLRVESGGGFVAPGFAFGSVPSASIYSDGTAITVGPTTQEYPGRALPNVISGKLADTDVRDLTTAAHDAGVTDPPPDLGQPPIADAPTTTFTVRSGAKVTVVSAYALGETAGQVPAGMTKAQSEARQKLFAFVQRAQRAVSQVREPYVATSLAVLVGPYPTDVASQPTPADAQWPGDDLASRTAADKFGARCITVSGAELAKVYPVVRDARANARWHSGAKTYQLTFRPELPDEHVCAP